MRTATILATFIALTGIIAGANAADQFPEADTVQIQQTASAERGERHHRAERKDRSRERHHDESRDRDRDHDAREKQEHSGSRHHR